MATSIHPNAKRRNIDLITQKKNSYRNLQNILYVDKYGQCMAFNFEVSTNNLKVCKLPSSLNYVYDKVRVQFVALTFFRRKIIFSSKT